MEARGGSRRPEAYDLTRIYGAAFAPVPVPAHPAHFSYARRASRSGRAEAGEGRGVGKADG